MTKEQELANGIREAISLLNKAIFAAAKEGLRIESLHEIDATSFEDKCPAIIYNALIVKKEYFE